MFVVLLVLLLGIWISRPNDPQPPPSERPNPPLAESTVVEFEGGYVVGARSEVETIERVRVATTRTGCYAPEPTDEERRTWTPHDAGGIPFAKLIGSSDSMLALETFERLFDKANRGPGFAKMSREEQNVLLAFDIDGEIADGGMDEFFWNSAGNCALRTVSALEEMGLVEDAQILREAIAMFPDASPSEDRATRFEQLDALDAGRSRLGDHDMQWREIGPAVAAYVRAHASAFAL